MTNCTPHDENFDAVGSSDDGCYLIFSCTIFVDQFGMQISNGLAGQLLGSGGASPGLLLQNGSLIGEGVGNSWVQAYPNGNTVELTDAALLEIFGGSPLTMPANLPQG